MTSPAELPRLLRGVGCPLAAQRRHSKRRCAAIGRRTDIRASAHLGTHGHSLLPAGRGRITEKAAAAVAQKYGFRHLINLDLVGERAGARTTSPTRRKVVAKMASVRESPNAAPARDLARPFPRDEKLFVSPVETPQYRVRTIFAVWASGSSDGGAGVARRTRTQGQLYRCWERADGEGCSSASGPACSGGPCSWSPSSGAGSDLALVSASRGARASLRPEPGSGRVGGRLWLV